MIMSIDHSQQQEADILLLVWRQVPHTSWVSLQESTQKGMKQQMLPVSKVITMHQIQVTNPEVFLSTVDVFLLHLLQKIPPL